MIIKSYLLEQSIEVIKNNVALFYGENLGLIQDFKTKIRKHYTKFSILKYTQDEILKNETLIYNEIRNESLFENNKIFFLDNANDKLLNFLEKILPFVSNNKIFLYSGILEKKSRLRNFFEKQKKVDIIPCYQDSQQTTKSLIVESLKGYSGLSSININIILNGCGTDRIKLRNEVEKIKRYFENKSIEKKELLKLLNLSENDNFNFVRDAALNGDKVSTNKLLENTNIEAEKSTLYLSSIASRISKIEEIIKNNDDVEKSINLIKPPIFWKDKPNFIRQANIWDLQRIKKASNKIYDTEIQIKSNSISSKKLLLKKLIVDICNLATAS